MRVFLMFFCVFTFYRCGPGPVGPEPSKDTSSDSGYDTDSDITGSDTSTSGGYKTPCEMACENIRLMGCDGAEGSPGPDEQYGNEDDLPCEDVCEHVMSEGDFSIEPECISKASNCDEVDACFH